MASTMDVGDLTGTLCIKGALHVQRKQIINTQHLRIVPPITFCVCKQNIVIFCSKNVIHNHALTCKVGFILIISLYK